MGYRGTGVSTYRYRGTGGLGVAPLSESAIHPLLHTAYHLHAASHRGLRQAARRAALSVTWPNTYAPRHTAMPALIAISHPTAPASLGLARLCAAPRRDAGVDRTQPLHERRVRIVVRRVERVDVHRTFVLLLQLEQRGAQLAAVALRDSKAVGLELKLADDEVLAAVHHLIKRRRDELEDDERHEDRLAKAAEAERLKQTGRGADEREEQEVGQDDSLADGKQHRRVAQLPVACGWRTG
eukprot:356565-Chlamydomonas_euryale.AAC.13